MPAPDGWEQGRVKRYGRTWVTFLHRGTTPAPSTTVTGHPWRTVLNPGSFDPIHLGHLDVVEQAVELFGHVTVAVMHNHEKTGGLFPVEQRMDAHPRRRRRGRHRRPRRRRRAQRAGHPRRRRAVGAAFIVKGLRTPADFEIEQQMALTNYSVTGMRTVYLPCRADRGYISSRFVREIARYGGSVTHMVPQCVADALRRAVPAEKRPTMTYDDGYDDDEYDEYDEIDDEYPEPGQGYVGDAETLLRRSIDIIATAPTMPLSSSPRIDRDEIIELLEEALQRLPDELRQARWMLKERQEFVAKTRREADELLEAARVRAERMVQRTEVVRAAEQRARQVMETAEADARRLRHETEDFLDQRLGSFEILLDKLQKTVGAGRQRLSIGSVPHAGRARTEEDDPTKGFFDQDR